MIIVAHRRNTRADLLATSPELQGRSDTEAVARMRRQLGRVGVSADAVCTGRPEAWT